MKVGDLKARAGRLVSAAPGGGHARPAAPSSINTPKVTPPLRAQRIIAGIRKERPMKHHVLPSLLLLSVPAIAGAQELPTQKILPLALAQEAAAAAVASCSGAGYRVSVVVVDADGVARVSLRGDGAGSHTINSAFRKAFTAATFNRPTSAWAPAIKQSAEVASMEHIDNILMAGGGMPIRAGNDLVGAIGNAGAPGFDKDEACAQAGIDKIKDRLR
jgi:uncharacterized protein GlcG (DUF336 family)